MNLHAQAPSPTDQPRGDVADPGPQALTPAEAITAAAAVAHANAQDSAQQQADAVRSWWLDNGGRDGHPPCAFAVLSLVLPADAFAIAFQAHFDAATAPTQESPPPA